MTKSLVLAIDQGGQSSRVAVYTTQGKQLHCFSAPCATSHQFVDGIEHIEQDSEVILFGIKNCIEKIQTHLGDDLKNIIAAGFAGQGSSLLCWDNKTGKALSPVLSWQDIRGNAFLKSLPLTNSQTQKLTGLRLSPHYGASKIRWCLDNNVEVTAAAKNNRLTIGPIVSYIFWHLTGKNFVDPGHAQRTLLWNLDNNQWDESLLNLFKIPRNILPECQWHNSFFGDFTLGAHKIPFTASARDQGASLFSRGLPDKNACYINIGTGAFIQRVTADLNVPDGLLVSPLWLPESDNNDDLELSSPICYATEFTNELGVVEEKSLYAWEATVNGAASAISFVEQQTGLQITPSEINSALQLDPEKECYFLNAVGGLSAPYWRTDLTSIFSKHLSPHETILAWLESIIFQISVNVALMNKITVAQKIYISGGFSNADLLCQKIADLTQVPVYRNENADATLQGIACMTAGVPDTWRAASQEDIFAPTENPHLQHRFLIWSDAVTKWLAH